MRTSRPSVYRLATFFLAAVVAAVSLTTRVSTQGHQRHGRSLVRGREVVTGEVLIKYRDRVRAQQSNVEWEADADESEDVGGHGVRLLHSRSLDAADLVAYLQSHPDVEYVEPNYIVYPDSLPNDPTFANLWGLLNTGQTIGGSAGTPGADIDAASAWDITTGSRAIVVGVVDTGIDYRHPDLAVNVWSAPAPFSVTIAGQSITCAAGTHGFNAITRTCDPMDDNNHGTHVSGTIGGVGNNGVGVAGVNWATSLMGLKFLGANGSGTTSDAINAIEFAVQAKAVFASSSGANVRVLSNSWGGGGFSQALLDEINRANAADMLFVAAAGNSHSNNDSTAYYPTNYNAPNVVSVAATDNADALAAFSNYGATTVDLAAPGVNILSTTRSNTYSYFSGTSMATPHVSGAAALFLSTCPLATAAVKDRLFTTIDLVAALTGLTATGGRLNVGRMLQDCSASKTTAVAVQAGLTAPQLAGRTITFTATPTGGTAPHQYKWLVYDGVRWTTVRNWMTADTYAWTPALANNGYYVRAVARSAWNSSNLYEASGMMPFAIKAKVSQVRIAANRVAPQATGTTITWTATATGGTAPYQYKWVTYDGSAWAATGWTAANTFAWTPLTASTASQVRVWVRGAWNTENAYEAQAIVTFAIRPRASITALTPNRVSPQVRGTTITWTAAAAGGTAPYSYKWWLWDGAAWRALTTWKTSATYTWTPTMVNNGYYMKVMVRSSWNATDTYESFTMRLFAIR